MIEAINSLLDQLARAEPLSYELFGSAVRPLVRRLSEGPAPRESLLNLRRLAEAIPKTAAWPSAGAPLGAVASVLSSGAGLTALLAARPERLSLLLSPGLGRAWSRGQLHADLARRLRGRGRDALEEPTDIDQVAEAIADFRNDHTVRLAACEFGSSSLEQVGLELSNVADMCLQTALDAVTAAHARHHGTPLCREEGEERPARMTTIAMGKYGAQELNFCSDIDVVFIYSSDDGAAGEQSLHQFFSGVCQQVVQVLSKFNMEGFPLRIDLRLRPEGSRGPICNSLDGAERYYETWGGPYDRLAWLKARVAAGDGGLGRAMLDILRPFVFPRITSANLIEDIKQLSRRIRAELAERRLVPGWDVKLGSGGIRDIEFFVQALQLMHAGKQTGLRERATLNALNRLLFAGLISDDERTALAEAYELYRRIEHRLQLHGGRQTHLLPTEGPFREQVVAHMGFAMADFERDIERCQRQVSAIYETLGAQEEAESDLAALVDADLPMETAEALLERHGFRKARWAAEQLHALTGKPWGPFGHSSDARIQRLAVPLLREVSASPDPDAALGHLVGLSLRVGPFEGPWVMFAEHREAMRLLCNLFGTSDLLAQLFVGHPELLDQLLLAGRATTEASVARLSDELDRRLELAHDVEQHFGVLEKFRNEEMLRVGLHDIAGGTDLESVWQQLSQLAEQVLRRLYAVVYGETVRRYGVPRHDGGEPARMAVIGLGKLGGCEMSYGSDLDLIFVHSGAGQTDMEGRQVSNGEFFAYVAQRLIRALTSGFVYGSLYEVDTRLRPSGSQGTLVTSRSSFEEYHQQAQVWERQVLIKARPVAGDVEFGEELVRWIEGYVYDEGTDRDRLCDEIARLRARMEAELAQEQGDSYNLKLGQGGLLDIEFVAQYYQLAHGHDMPAFRVRSTLEALEAIGDADLLDEGKVSTLVEGYRFLRLLEGRLRVVRGRSAERLPTVVDDLEVTARRLGYRRQGARLAGHQLLESYRAQTAAVRAVYNHVFALS